MPENDLTRSVFEGFDIAIRLQASSTTKTVNITQCWFDNNVRTDCTGRRHEQCGDKGIDLVPLRLPKL
jgi:hypothetical protein